VGSDRLVNGEVTVIIPSFPKRAPLLARALASVTAQTRPVAAISVAVDLDRQGAPATRDRALAAVQTELVAPLDDDDELDPEHLAKLVACMEATGASLVFPWYTVVGGTDPFPQWFGVPWEDNRPHQVPVAWLARTSLVRQAGGFGYGWDATQGADPGVDADGNRAGEDYRLILRMVAAGARIVHLPERTWRWHHDSSNTMGLPSRWP
jgi:glycosyltransferase involved in cell wall biosynthesis